MSVSDPFICTFVSELASLAPGAVDGRMVQAWGRIVEMDGMQRTAVLADPVAAHVSVELSLEDVAPTLMTPGSLWRVFGEMRAAVSLPQPPIQQQDGNPPPQPPVEDAAAHDDTVGVGPPPTRRLIVKLMAEEPALDFNTFALTVRLRRALLQRQGFDLAPFDRIEP